MKVAVRLFAGLRERAGARAAAIELPAGAHVADVWPALDLGDEPPGLLYAVNKELRGARPRARGRRRGGADPTGLRRRVPPLGASRSRSTRPCAEVATRRGGRGRDVRRARRARSSRGRTVVHLEYEAYEGMAEQAMAGSPRS